VVVIWQGTLGPSNQMCSHDLKGKAQKRTGRHDVICDIHGNKLRANAILGLRSAKL
jgi:hypothetical protein